MAIPEFQALLLPLLRLTADGTEHALAGANDSLAADLTLTADELDQRNPSGLARTFYNRVAWSSTYLRAAGLLVATKRGHFRITERGQALLAEQPTHLGIHELMRYPEFRAIRTSGGRKRTAASVPATVDAPEPDPVAVAALSPEEALETAYATLRTAVEAQLLERVRTARLTSFERLVVALLVAMGYGGTRAEAARSIGPSDDGGIEGVVTADRLGLDLVLVRAGQWALPIGQPAAEDLVEALTDRQAGRGVYITTGTVDPEARAWLREVKPRVVALDGVELAHLLFEFGIGVVQVGDPYTVKRVDLGGFDEE
jgi:restriction system protein